MSNHRRIPICATIALAAASTLFSVAWGLAYYSGERIAATVGDRYPSAVEQVAVWIGLLMQPWAFVAVLFEITCGIDGPRNFFSVKVLRVDLEAGFKRLLFC